MTSLPLDPIALVVIALAVFLINVMKGAFGGGFAIIGIPVLALVMDPIAAGALLALVLCLSDIVALGCWRPSTWSKPDLKLLIPGQLLGIGAGSYSCALQTGTLLQLSSLSSHSGLQVSGSEVVAKSGPSRDQA